MANQENTFQFRVLDGKISIGSEYNNARLNERKKKGGRGRIIFDLPESRNQRKFLEGCLIPMCVYFQENLNHEDSSDLEFFRNYIIGECLGYDIKLVKVGDKIVPKKKRRSSAGAEKLKTVSEFIIDYLVCEFGVNQDNCLNPDKYKQWRDEIYPHGGPDNYIEYLIETRDLIK